MSVRVVKVLIPSKSEIQGTRMIIPLAIPTMSTLIPPLTANTENLSITLDSLKTLFGILRFISHNVPYHQFKFWKPLNQSQQSKTFFLGYYAFNGLPCLLIFSHNRDWIRDSSVKSELYRRNKHPDYLRGILASVWLNKSIHFYTDNHYRYRKVFGTLYQILNLSLGSLGFSIP